MDMKKIILIFSITALCGCVDETKKQQDQLDMQLDSISKAQLLLTDSLLNG